MSEELWLRAALAAIVGALLGLNGSLCQVSTHNSLSAPATLGLTGAGVLFVLVAYFVKEWMFVSMSLEGLALIAMSMGAVVLFVFASKLRELRHIVLLGIAFNLFIGAIFSIVQFALLSKGADFPQHIWFGTFRYVNSNYLLIFLPLLIISLIICRKLTPSLELMNMGEQFARSHGVRTRLVTLSALGLSFINTSLIVIYFGVFSFVGLVMPHVLRSMPWFKFSIANELLYGALLSGVIFALLDALCFHFPLFQGEIPVGMLSAVLGSLALMGIVLGAQKSNN